MTEWIFSALVLILIVLTPRRSGKFLMQQKRPPRQNGRALFILLWLAGGKETCYNESKSI